MNNFRHVAAFGSAVLIVFAIVCASVGAAAEIIRQNTAAGNLEIVRHDEVREALAKYDEQCEEVHDEKAV